MDEHKGYLIFGIVITVPDSAELESEGLVFATTPGGAFMIKRLKGRIFRSRRNAVAHGVELCKKWIDEHPNPVE
jgi:hypothetical protein